MNKAKPLHNITHVKSHLHQAITLTKLDGSTSDVTVPNGAVHMLHALLDGAGDRRLVCTTAVDISAIAEMSARTANAALQFLEQHHFVEKLYTGGLRRIRIAMMPDDPKAAALPPTMRDTLRTVAELGGGASTFTLYITEYIAAMKQATPSAIEARHRLNALAARGIVVDLIPATHKLSLYRVDVRRGAGENVFEQLPAAELDRRDPALLLTPAKLRAIGAAQ